MTNKEELNALAKAANTFEDFIKSQAFGGVLLVFCTIVALIWANSPYAAAYFKFDHAYLGVFANGAKFGKSIQHWINDGLMSIFFLLVGLEIKREVLSGELSAMSKALLPIFAAIGGMVLPALIFVAINFKHDTNLVGWAIPMATDIAFAIGVLSLLSKRIPRSLVIFLSAIAIVDDLGAILVIAIFYSAHISVYYLLLSLLSFIVLILMNCFRVKKVFPYLLVGAVLWYVLMMSGVHATIAGVLLALTIPGKNKYSPEVLSQHLRSLMERFDHVREKGEIESEARKGILQSVENLVHEVETPLQRLEHALHTPVNYLIIPIFVLFNAGISFVGVDFKAVLFSPLSVGIILGLFVGKPLGIFGVTWVMKKLKVVELPQGVSMIQILGVSLLAGIGFTMSIFISDLAFGAQDYMLLSAKVGILCASLVSAVIGFGLLWVFSNHQQTNKA